MRFHFNNEDISPSRKFSRSRGIQIWAPKSWIARWEDICFLRLKIKMKLLVSTFSKEITKRSIIYLQIFEIFSSILYPSFDNSNFTATMFQSSFTILILSLSFNFISFYYLCWYYNLYYFTVTISPELAIVNSKIIEFKWRDYRNRVRSALKRRKKGKEENSNSNHFALISNNEIIMYHIKL